jgi:methylated-DNA-[protein]-cysteine S-methyltransferase
MKTPSVRLCERIACHPQVTVFRRNVYAALLEVPRGRVTTYGLLARRAGCGSARAVGGALRANPFAPEVPCHRVVAADFSIGGFCGSRTGVEITRKIALLISEGVPLDAAGRLLDARRVWRFGPDQESGCE